MSPKLVDRAEIEAREEAIMQQVLVLMAEQGVAGVTIDKVVARLPFSKGTVYNHFSCKEDLLTGVCNRSLKKLIELFERAGRFSGNTREQMLAVGYAYLLHAMLYPVEFMLVISAKTPAVKEKSSSERQETHLELENRLLSSLLDIIHRAQLSGELKAPAHLNSQQIAFSLWSMSFGTIALLHESLDRCNVRQDMQVKRELMNNCHLMLDGLGWSPDSSRHDWEASLARFDRELFATEIAALSTTTE
ncbi:TetR/AcrR family transcriptional regulator [Neptuniibacter halophilus]|uniref:TetR/AcrR family transcriptional regulator n=1 Tax=Neptuniibacter halophilus TaxID=651666 RepID=UPI0025736083|nr:TetR/AcrR family transcriptional regulator [Neptuniibacter halophilus]